MYFTVMSKPIFKCCGKFLAISSEENKIIMPTIIDKSFVLFILKKSVMPKTEKYIKKLIFINPPVTIVTIIIISNLSKKPPIFIRRKVSSRGKTDDDAKFTPKAVINSMLIIVKQTPSNITALITVFLFY